MTKMQFFLELKHRAFKVPEGAKITGLALVVKVVLFPIQWLHYYLDKKANVREDFYTGCIYIHGYCITNEYFHHIIAPTLEEGKQDE